MENSISTSSYSSIRNRWLGQPQKNGVIMPPVVNQTCKTSWIRAEMWFLLSKYVGQMPSIYKHHFRETPQSSTTTHEQIQQQRGKNSIHPTLSYVSNKWCEICESFHLFLCDKFMHLYNFVTRVERSFVYRSGTNSDAAWRVSLPFNECFIFGDIQPKYSYCD